MNWKRIAYWGLGLLLLASAVPAAELRRGGANDLEWAAPNQGAETYTTSPQGKTVTKIDAGHVPWRNAPGYVDSLVDQSYTVTIYPAAIVMNGGTISGGTFTDLTATNATLTNAIITYLTVPDLSIPPGKLQATSWSATGTKFYRDDGAWAAVEGIEGYATLPVTGSQIDNGTLNWNNFPADVKPIHIVAALPTCGSASYPTGSVVYLNTDYKLYICEAGATWGQMVKASDISAVVSDNAIREEIIGTAQFAQTIRPIQLVNGDPALPNSEYPAGSIIYNIAAGVLRKTNNGLTWENAITTIPAIDITGTISPSQISGLNASQILGQLTSDQIASLAAAKITGDIAATTIADGIVTTPKLAAGAVAAGKLAASAVEAGTIAANAVQAGNIAANAVQAGNIATNAVTAGTVAAGAIGATQIAAGAVVAEKIGANAITTEKLLAGAVTAAKIQSGSITSNELASNSVVADKIAVGAVSAAKISTTSLSAITATLGDVSSGTLVGNNGTVLVAVGRVLLQGALTTQYPANTGTYFSNDSAIHVYRWINSAWTQVGILGDGAYGGGGSTSVYGKNTVGVWGETLDTGGFYGVFGRGNSAGSYGGYFTVSTSYENQGAPIVIAAATDLAGPPSHIASKGAVWVGNTGNAFMAVNSNGGYSAWKTMGMATGNLSGYSLAEGSMYTVSGGVYARVNQGGVVQWVAVYSPP